MLNIDEAYRRYFPIIRAKCGRMLRDAHEAQDVAQETFLRLIDADLRDPQPAVVSAWIYRTSTRLAISRLRARKSRGQSWAEAAEETVLSPGDIASRTLARDLLAQLAQLLPESELQAAILHRVDGLTHAEIAEVMQISDRTVRRMLDRLDERLAKFELALEQENAQP